MAKYKRRSYNAAGGQDDGSSWVPKVDKNPFYRTMDIFNGVFKKNIKLAAGKMNATDMRTIFLDFGELKPSRIVHVVGPSKKADNSVFGLECGHEWEGKTNDNQGNPKVPGKDWGRCGICGAKQVYRGFEHEWQHIIFKSDLAARKIFCEQYADKLLANSQDIDRTELINFLAILVNAFDDIRVNSLWEKIYPGSAAAIWERWQYFTERMGDSVNTSFIPFLFAVAFKVPTDPYGEFEPMRPAVEWAVNKVKYRGFTNMLIDVRVVLDRCMGALLAKMPPRQRPQPPPPPPAVLPEPSKGDNSGTDQETEKRSSQESSPNEGQEQNGSSSKTDVGTNGPHQVASGSSGTESSGSGEESDPEEGDSSQVGASSANAGTEGMAVEEEQRHGSQDAGGYGGASGSVNIPSAKAMQSSKEDYSNALSHLMTGAKKLDPKEEHSEPSQDDLDLAQASQALRAMLAKAMNRDISDLNDLDAAIPTGETDEDMQKQIDQLQSAATIKTDSSILTSNAKARITLIEVTRDGVSTAQPLELDDDERFAVARLRSAFFKIMGSQKAKRGPSGNQVDVQALLQYRNDHQDPNVFETEDINQGFAYSVLCDMSGSMHSTFPTVCKAVEVLKQALDFPFVKGTLWGFRGAGFIPGGSTGNGEVWMYRYAKDVNWYKGTAKIKTPSGPQVVPVECGGITPMNSAINVASAHLWRKMPTGMAKRMFLLTDGSPVHTKVSGTHIPEFLLRQFVAKEIRDARKHGIEVFTIVIGEHSIDEDKCLQMFGPRRFWRRVGTNRVGTVLTNLVLENFSKYIRTKS